MLQFLGLADQIVSLPRGLHRKSFGGKSHRRHPLRYSVRYMQEDDLPQVAEIDRESAPQWPYPAYAYKRELNNHLASYIVIVEPAPHGNRPAGTTTAIHCWVRCCNGSATGPGSAPAPRLVGAYLHSRLCRGMANAGRGPFDYNCRGKQTPPGHWRVASHNSDRYGYRIQGLRGHFEVRASNHIAQALYRKYGFKDVGTRKAYYSRMGKTP